MSSIFGILVTALGIMAFELPSLLRKKMRRELIAFLFFLLLAVGLTIAHILKVDLPSPLDVIAAILKPMNDWVEGLFK